MPKDLKFSGGWVKLHRVLKNKAIWKCSQPQQKVVLIQILMEANWELNEWLWKGKKYKCVPGEFITSLKALSSGAGVGARSVRTALANFSTIYDFLEYESTNVSTKIKVKNWEEYQGDGKETDKSATSGASHDRQGCDKGATTNKEEKKDKNKKQPPKPPAKKDKTTTHPIDKITDTKINVSALRSFYDDRVERKSRMTTRSITMVVNKLVKRTHAEQQIMVDDAIEKGWKSVFTSSLDKKDAAGNKEKLPDNYFDPYASPIFLKGKAKGDAIKVPKELTIDDREEFNFPADDTDWDALTQEEKKAKWQELKKKACRKLPS